MRDPMDYLMHFREHMTLMQGDDALLKAFPSSLRGLILV